MKKLLSFLFVFCLLAGGSNLFAQASDTLAVPVLDPAQGEFLNQFIANDNQAHSVYVLAKGETYWINGPIISDGWHLNLVGEPVDIRAEQPATVRPTLLGDGTIPNFTFDASGDLTLKNLNVLSVGPQGTRQQQFVAQVKTDDVTVTIDNCIFEGNNEFGIYVTGLYPDVFLTNSIFRNNQNLTQYYNGRGVWTTQPTDTVEILNCTFVNSGAYVFTDTDHTTQFLRFEHNTVVNILNTPFFLHQQTNSVISNNLFFNADFLGQSDLEFLGGWDDFDGQLSAIISVDTLNATADSVMDATSGGDFTEADRSVAVRNNAYFWEQDFVDFWNSADSLHGPVWMNDRTQAMFADDASYPNLVAENNVNTGVTFTQSPGTKTDQLTQIHALREPNGPETLYWVIGGTLGAQSWPLPENLSYSDATLETMADGGFPVGDLNWFGLVDEWEDFLTSVDEPNELADVPSGFELLQNYPNPFNPSTSISYKISQNVDVKLNIYNLLGQEVRSLVNEKQEIGTHTVTWDGTDRFAKCC